MRLNGDPPRCIRRDDARGQLRQHLQRPGRNTLTPRRRQGLADLCQQPLDLLIHLY
ncbi:hypothetical protein ACN28E_34645 [Archangium lansingense]|uniref:hypothetical protein n=1 Tax=Archangium lansingense TaxID=2995310 RepID=UPI003B7C7E1D